MNGNENEINDPVAFISQYEKDFFQLECFDTFEGKFNYKPSNAPGNIEKIIEQYSYRNPDSATIISNIIHVFMISVVGKLATQEKQKTDFIVTPPINSRIQKLFWKMSI